MSLMRPQVLVACGAVHELQRGAQGLEGAGGHPAGRLGRHRWAPRRRQGDAGHVGPAESLPRVLCYFVLGRFTLARELHLQELLFSGLRPCLQVKTYPVSFVVRIL